MAVTFVASEIPSPTATTTGFTITIPTVEAGDMLVLATTNRDGTDAPTIGDDDGGTWDEVAVGTTGDYRLFARRATAATSGKTITGSGFTGSCAAPLLVARGVKSDGTVASAFSAITPTDPGGNSLAEITPDVDGVMVVAALYQGANDVAVTSPAWATLGAGTLIEHRSTGGSDCAAQLIYAEQATAAATGDLTWTQASDAGQAMHFWLIPDGGGGDATVNAAVLTAAAAVQAPAITGGASTAPAVLGATASVQAPSVTGGASVGPTIIAATATVQAPDVSGTASVAPDALGATAAVQAPAVSADCIVTVGAALGITASVPAASVTTDGSVTVDVAALALSAALQAPAVSAGASVEATALSLAASAVAPAVAAGATVSPDVLAMIASVIAPAVTAQGGVTVTPDVLTLLAGVLAPSVSVTTPGLLGLCAEVRGVPALTATARHAAALSAIGYAVPALTATARQGCPKEN